ncbi:Uma2 family endonuclease [[Phormidium ambiguum] IAM M-71]|nr:Uma2 family endonuclease [Phormidium ambiguum]
MMTTTFNKSANRVLLENISWQTYQDLLLDCAEQPGIRLTYDQGKLEIMTPLDPHESSKKLMGRFVEAATEELNIEIRSLGSRTCQRKDLARGLEPDQCYYIQNERIVRGIEQIDLNEYPPPDLVIEIDITSSSMNRLGIYTALGVPEIWRYDDGRLIILRLEDGEYMECDRSPSLSLLTPSEIMRFLELGKTMGETSLIRLFREWVRTQVKEGE